ncbi:hypothetical protein ACFT7S_22100 [Streptomyces sp. NPDC057136]|uniref:hypothetical protein n=1 Tax=Streptomyces sp. NPDC057136 TaxID=3346029 RepID=UPI003643D14A
MISRLMGHDAFAHHGLGSSALMVIGALHLRPGQTVQELIGSSSVSRATVYRALHRLASHHLVTRTEATWTLSPRVIEGIGHPGTTAQSPSEPVAVEGWGHVADSFGTTGTAERRKQLHATERAAYLQGLEQRSQHRTTARFIVHDDGRVVLLPSPRGDEVPARWQAPDGGLLDPATGRSLSDWRVATDGRLILVTPADQRSYDELVAAHAEALSDWESAA